ncbi:autotransporter secretion outer membrane protein TamA [Enhydrobacter aerosaccus]|uniref:Autotransporter secretion outer membrane protein TamA n=1 Tax=Enhydrobacter aerosaccus TaxID=225324 RepID=A0A1T4PIK0_9HYPH|nr:autotransporter assembly complex family protein [Enhydrobacter aerosaccus]SJZ90668.1 autotransporter secretion outer membrane protein TamA [Enhydrobacter aerosaccus]
MFAGILKNILLRRRTGTLWIGRITPIVVMGLMACGGAYARTGHISLTIVGDERMTDELKQLSADLDKDQPLSGDALALLQGAQARRSSIASALRSRGFYDSRVIATVDNRPIEDASALDAIENQPDSADINFAFNVATGPIYRVESLNIDGPKEVVDYPGLDRSKLALKPGQPADAATIINAENQILDQVREHGYALAKVARREVVIDHATRLAYVTYYVQPGPEAKMGPVHFSGTEKVDTTYLQKRVPFKAGQPYAPDKVSALRDRLNALGVFSAIRIKQATALNDKGELPIDVDLQDRLPRTIGFGVSYETILGAGANVSWLHRNLFGEAESLRLSALVNHIGQGAIPSDLGYGFKADFLKPDWWIAGQDATATALASRDVYPAYTRNGASLAVGLNRVLSPHWRVSAGLSIEASQITQYGLTSYYKLFGVPLMASLNESNSDLDPTRGYRLVLNVSPYADLNHSDDLFAIAKLVGTTYLDVSGDGRSVVASRAAFGSIPGGHNVAIPPDKQFYAGGGGSIRGFTYQSAGPRDAYNNPIGGASLVEASLEFRQRFGESLGAVVFVDAGGAYTNTLPNFSQMFPRIGTGVGVRYYTGFGPLRLDVGLPLNKRQGDAPFGVYVSIGQAF